MGGRRGLANLVTGTVTMLIIGVLLNIVGLGIFCWALLALELDALPFFVGMTVGIIFISSRGRSVRCHRRWLHYGRFRTRHRAVHVLSRPFSRCPPCHWAAICASCGTRRRRCDLRACSCWGSSGLVAGVFAIFGAITVGSTAWARVSILTEPAQGGSVARAQPSYRLGQ